MKGKSSWFLPFHLLPRSAHSLSLPLLPGGPSTILTGPGSKHPRPEEGESHQPGEFSGHLTGSGRWVQLSPGVSGDEDHSELRPEEELREVREHHHANSTSQLTRVSRQARRMTDM